MAAKQPQELVFANQRCSGYNTVFTTKRAGNHRPFFLVGWIWSSKLPPTRCGGYRVFCTSGIELNTRGITANR